MTSASRRLFTALYALYAQCRITLADAALILQALRRHGVCLFVETRRVPLLDEMFPRGFPRHGGPRGSRSAICHQAHGGLCLSGPSLSSPPRKHTTSEEASDRQSPPPGFRTIHAVSENDGQGSTVIDRRRNAGATGVPHSAPVEGIYERLARKYPPSASNTTPPRYDARYDWPAATRIPNARTDANLRSIRRASFLRELLLITAAALAVLLALCGLSLLALALSWTA